MQRALRTSPEAWASVACPSAVHALQRGAGNRATSAMFARSRSFAGAESVQRMHAPPADDNTALQQAEAYIAQHAAVIIGAYQSLAQAVLSSTALPSVRDAIFLAMTAMGTPASGPVKNTAGTLLMPPNAPVIGPQRHPAVTLAVQTLNLMEQEVLTHSVVGGDVRTIKVGTEFTFSDGKDTDEDKTASGNLRVVAIDDRTKDQKKAHTAASSTIAEWAQLAVDGAASIPGRPEVNTVPHAGKAEYAKKVVYAFEGQKPWSWYWVADIDEACYETQTMPTTVNELAGAGAIKEIVAKHIFANAASLGLNPDPTQAGGSGHLTFDVTTAFGDPGRDGAFSFELLLETLQSLQENSRTLTGKLNKPEKGKTAGESDPINAPWLKDQEVRDDDTVRAADGYVAVLGLLKAQVLAGDLTDMNALVARLVQFNRTLTNPGLSAGERKTHIEDPKNISHYQAVNVEHVKKRKKDDETDRRLEIRDVPAQTSHAKLVSDLDIITTELASVRELVLSNVRQRIYNADDTLTARKEAIRKAKADTK